MEVFALIAVLAVALVVFTRALLSGREAYGSSADFLNWSSLVAPGVVVCKDGSFLAGWEVEGLDTESLEPEVLEATLARFARGLTSFQEGDALWMRLDRRPFHVETGQPLSMRNQGVDLLEKDMRAQLISEDLYHNALHLCWQHRPAEEGDVATQVEEFNRLAEAAQARLGSAIRLRRLTVREVERAEGPSVRTDELVDHLAGAVSGRNRSLRVPKFTEHLYVDTLLAVDFDQAELSEFPVIDGRMCAVLSIEGLPPEYPPEALAELERIEFEYAWVSRFAPQARAKTRATVNTLRKQWRQSAANVSDQISGTGGGDRDVHADAMAAELDGIIADVGRNGSIYGSFSSTLMIFADPDTDLGLFRRKVEAVGSSLQDVGFLMREERHSALEVFLASLPGHSHRRPRDVYVSARNFADLMPLRTLWKGEDYCPSPLFPNRSPSLMLGRSSTGELFRFNLHHGDVGHTMIFGPTSGGKSVLLGAIAGHFLKYNQAQVVYFDKRRSVQRACHVFEGSFVSFEDDAGKGFAPLLDAPLLVIDWTKEWLNQMLVPEHAKYRSKLLAEVSRVVDNMFETGNFTLYHVANFLNDEGLRATARSYLGGILDAPNAGNDITWSALTVFETHELFDKNEAMAVLVLDYIFASVDRRFTGQPTLLIIDEAWAFLKHPIFVKRIQHWLKESRKSNVAVVLATQSLSDVVNSPITPVLLESCYTKIFLPNGGAKTDDASNQYRALGLNTAQIDLVASLVPKRDYYLVKPGVARVVDFAFGELTLNLIGKTSSRESKAAAEAYANDPQYWMAEAHEILTRALATEAEDLEDA